MAFSVQTRGNSATKPSLVFAMFALAGLAAAGFNAMQYVCMRGPQGMPQGRVTVRATARINGAASVKVAEPVEPVDFHAGTGKPRESNLMHSITGLVMGGAAAAVSMLFMSATATLSMLTHPSQVPAFAGKTLVVQQAQPEAVAPATTPEAVITPDFGEPPFIAPAYVSPKVVAPQVVAPVVAAATTVVPDVVAQQVVETSVEPAIAAGADSQLISEDSVASAKPLVAYDPALDPEMISFYGYAKPKCLYAAHKH